MFVKRCQRCVHRRLNVDRRRLIDPQGPCAWICPAASLQPVPCGLWCFLVRFGTDRNSLQASLALRRPVPGLLIAQTDQKWARRAGMLHEDPALERFLPEKKMLQAYFLVFQDRLAMANLEWDRWDAYSAAHLVDSVCQGSLGKIRPGIGTSSCLFILR